MKFPHQIVLIDRSRKETYSIVLGVWALVAAYAILHDQYIVRLSPEHFTVHHEPLWQIKSPGWLAAVYAFRASVGPGLLLGIACAAIHSRKTAKRLTLRKILVGVFWVIVATEMVSLLSGAVVFALNQPLYPEVFYPEMSKPLLVTTTIQITCYLSAGLFSLLLLFWLRRTQVRVSR